MAELNFLGRGWSFPPTFTEDNVHMLEHEEDVRSSLEILLTTAPGERIMLPRYGCNLEQIIFETLDTTTKTLIADQIETALLLYEPRIDVKRINLNTDQELDGIVLIEIDYVIRSTNSRYNFVYPFYKKEGTNLPD